MWTGVETIKCFLFCMIGRGVEMRATRLHLWPHGMLAGARQNGHTAASERDWVIVTSCFLYPRSNDRPAGG